MSTKAPEVSLTPAISLAGIDKSFAGVPALRQVQLEVLPGEVHALLGENGAGKSTLMNIASGSLKPDAGTIIFEGVEHSSLTPAEATALGLGIVHQHPAVLPDLTVAENLRLAIPKEFLTEHGSVRATMRWLLDDVGCTAHLEDRVDTLSLAQKHLLELAKGLAVHPKVLILDEPTAPLSQDSVDLLFQRVRSAAASGTAIIYITHRLAEVRELADRVTVLRDGQYRGTATVDSVSDQELLSWIVGRQLDATFPDKPTIAPDAPPYLVLSELSTADVHDISLTLREGEILGVGGVAGNGQSELMATLAGLSPFTGTVELSDSTCTERVLRNEGAYLPADRHTEGLMMSLSVRENAAVQSMPRFRRSFGLLSTPQEVKTVGGELLGLDVKAPSMDANVAALSGGNQQKVVLARALLSNPKLVVADEPTQGVDVGARAEIYRILRETASSGTPVVVASSDAKELEGLCDRVVVMSRGQIVEELAGDEVTEERMITAAVSATAQRRDKARRAQASRSARLTRFIRGDYAPVAILAVVMLALGAYVSGQNDRYLSDFNITSVQMLVAALGFIAMGQTIALIMAGIDLSVGPLAGFLVVVGSFFLIDGVSSAKVLTGFFLMAVAAALAGLLNGFLIRFGRFTPVAATLVLYIGLQGLSFLLRDGPDGLISGDITGMIMTKVGPFPVVFILLVVFAFLLEALLRYRPWGLRLRALGSDEANAKRVGVPISRTLVLGYVAASLCVFLGAIVLMAQIGIGDPAQGVGYTLSSITAVVLGGTSLLGGRGTFIGTLLGAGLIVQVLNATTFLGLDQTWQYFFQGALVLVAALVFSQVRRERAL